MSNQENNMQVLEADLQPELMRLTKSKFMPKKKASNPIPVLLGESILVAGSIPIILFFFTGIINGVLLMVYQAEYDTGIGIKKVEKVLAGKSADDVSDMIRPHIIGGTTGLWALILLYFQQLFAFVKYLYKWSGYIFGAVWLGTLIYNSVAAWWLAMNTCTSTELYGLAMYNTIFYFVVAFLYMLTVTLVLFIRALILTRSTVSPQKVRETPKEHLGESEERMIEEKEDNKDAGEGEEDTEDDKNKFKKNRDPEDEPEEEEEKQSKRKNIDPVDEDEEEEQNLEDQLEEELGKIE